MRKDAFLLLTLVPLFSLIANNVKIENVSLTNQNTVDHYTHVQFDISWDNSWRDMVNWDAAWVFVKYRAPNGYWHHARISSDEAHHFGPSSCKIHTVGDETGVMLYRNSSGAGSIDWDTITLRWEYDHSPITNDDIVTVKVFAIEMVNIPQASYQLGDALSEAHFYDAGSGTFQPFTVDFQGSIIIANSGSGNLWAKDGLNITAGMTDNNFPTGYMPFYCMKYEVTQEQYVDFLNTMDHSSSYVAIYQEGPFVMDEGINNPEDDYRNGIRYRRTYDAGLDRDIDDFYCDYNNNFYPNDGGDGENIPCNFLLANNMWDFADWTGMRPMTELEFEKICRGDQGFVEGEFAWGNTRIFFPTDDDIHRIYAWRLSGQGGPNEIMTETVVNIGVANYGPFRANIGPFRSGIFAKSNTSREESGSGYYGVMEMSGNLAEMVVSITQLTFNGIHGDGDGFPSQRWDLHLRGGSFNDLPPYLQTSDRYLEEAGTTRKSYVGFRCVKSNIR